MTELTVFTWNIAECLLSKAAPRDGTWDIEDTDHHIQTEILANQADFICLQEAPTDNYAFSDAYQLLGATESHSGYVQLFVRKSLHPCCHNIKILNEMAVATEVRIGSQHFGIVSVHLKPYPRNAPIRLLQLRLIMEHFGALPFLIVGDANMQDVDAVQFLESYKNLQIIDLHTQLNGGRPFLWDLEINKYFLNAQPDKFNFDRIFAVGPQWAPRCCNVRANVPMPKGEGHFLSDHFALFAKLSFSPPASS